MEKLASCLPHHGATSSQRFKLSTLHRPTPTPTPGPRSSRPISTVRCAPSSHAGIAAAAIATAGDTETHRYDDVNGISRSFDLERYMSRNAETVHAALDAALTGLECPALLADSMRYSALGGGKLVRPVLSIACCELVGGRAAAALPVACAAELVHAASLVHDDMPCMDDDALRRGKPSCHAAFGEHAALLAGDALLALAFEHVARESSCHVGAHADRVIRAVAELAAAAGAGGVAAGQVADKASECDVTVSLRLAGLEYIHVHKTARLVEAAAVCGAVVGGGGPGEVERVRRYARRVGLLFQVVDDVLDVTRTSEQLGKTAGKDVAAGKATYPRLMGIDKARAYAGELLALAEAELDGFDAQRAAPLRHLARFVAYREH
ncbi:hypothetical protein QOZ80_1AG0005750 [Eleusine coracana subsp. coracana]|nr:hypothetical protein QOZ80_1AG0005750 [Eleusine coracana subsp. coracana]